MTQQDREEARRILNAVARDKQWLTHDYDIVVRHLKRIRAAERAALLSDVYDACRKAGVRLHGQAKAAVDGEEPLCSTAWYGTIAVEEVKQTLKEKLEEDEDDAQRETGSMGSGPGATVPGT